MKNRIINNFVLVAMALAGISCSDFLDTNLDTFTTPERVETRYSTLWSFANAFYAPMQSGFDILDGNLFAAASDEAIQTSRESDANFFNNGTVNASINPIESLYSKYYEGIRAALFFLDYAKDGETFLTLNRDTSSVTSAENHIAYERQVRSLRWYRAEANVAMAYYYAELLKMYGGVPIVTTQYGDGKSNGDLKRASYDDVVDYIVELIDSQLDNLQENWATHPDNVAGNAGRFDKAAAMAIKARALLYAASPRNNPDGDVEKWKRAAKAAKDLIDFKDYTMPKNRAYGPYFVGANGINDKETIFSIRTAASNSPETANYPIATPGGNSGITPTENLVADYEYTGLPDIVNPYANRDPRLEATIVFNGCRWNSREINESKGGSDDMAAQNASRTGYYLRKFLTDNVNLKQGATAQHVWVAYRYAEVLLNYAEAMNEAYGPDAVPDGYTKSAREALMEVRNSASTSLPAVTASDKVSFRKVVKHERRIELAFEDHRYWDLVRWLDAETELSKPIKGVKITKTSTGVYKYQTKNIANRTFNERNYYMPFPQSEILNSHGALEQNPGY